MRKRYPIFLISPEMSVYLFLNFIQPEIDKKGAIKVDQVESSRNDSILQTKKVIIKVDQVESVSPCYHLEWHQLYINRQDFNLGWIKMRKRYYIFNIT